MSNDNNAEAAPADPPATPLEEIQAMVSRLKGKADEWHAAPYARKLELLAACRRNLATPEVLDAWVDASCRAHGYDRNDPEQAHLVAEVYIKGPGTTGMYMAGLQRRLEALDATGRLPELPKGQKRPDGTTRVQTWPIGGMVEKMSANGSVGELQVEGDVEQATAEQIKAEHPPGLVAILGAGNYEAPTEALHYLFNEGRVAAFKLNPVNAAAGRGAERVFAPLVDAGYLAFVYGGVDEGQALINAPDVDEACMVGSARAYNCIVWGSPEPPADEAAEPVLKKPFTAELGSVNPFVVVPSKWSDSELDAQASQLVAAKKMNSGHICASPAVILTDRAWPQRERFLERVRHHLRASKPKRAYYPNARRSHDTFLQRLQEETGKSADELVVREEDEALAAKLEPSLPTVFATGVPPDSFALRNESFAPVLTEMPIDVPDGSTFADEALRIVNEQMWGSLTAILIVHTKREQDEDVQRFIDGVRVGTLAINGNSVYAFLNSQLAWGAYGDGHPERDIQSGRGRLGNAYGLRRVRKTILRFPFTYMGMPQAGTPPAALLKQMQRLTEFAAKQSGWSLFKLVVNAATGL